MTSTVPQATQEWLDDAGYVKAADLVAIGDIAKIFDVRVQTASSWVSRRNTNSFPAPVATLSNGPVFDGVEVIRWWKSWRPKKGAKAGTLPEDLR